MLSQYYNKEVLISSFWDGVEVSTPYGRKIACDRDHALNYLLQSTSSDVCMEQAFRIRKIFEGCKTKICYLLHDSVVLDFSREDLKKFEELSSSFFTELKDSFVYKETNFSGIFVYNYESEITSTDISVN